MRLAYRPGAAASKTLTPETLTPPPVFSFTLANSVRDMWRAGVYPLAALIGVFSGGWPYLKLFLMLIAWVANPGAGPRFGFDAARVETLRGDALSALDALGKWSLVDAFVMILFRAAFAFRLEAADEDGNRVAIDAEVRPEYGFQSFLLATVLSLALGHVASAWHREDRERAEEARQATTPFGDEGVGGAIEDRGARRAASDADGALPSSDMTRASNETTRVSSYRDSDSDGAPRVATRHSAASRAEDVAVAGGLIFAAGLLVIGAHADAIRFDFEGAAGAALGPTRASRTFSLVALARALPPASSAALVLVAFTVAAPLARVAVALALWLAPTTKRERRLARASPRRRSARGRPWTRASSPPSPRRSRLDASPRSSSATGARSSTRGSARRRRSAPRGGWTTPSASAATTRVSTSPPRRRAGVGSSSSPSSSRRWRRGACGRRRGGWTKGEGRGGTGRRGKTPGEPSARWRNSSAARRAKRRAATRCDVIVYHIYRTRVHATTVYDIMTVYLRPLRQSRSLGHGLAPKYRNRTRHNPHAIFTTSVARTLLPATSSHRISGNS